MPDFRQQMLSVLAGQIKKTGVLADDQYFDRMPIVVMQSSSMPVFNVADRDGLKYIWLSDMNKFEKWFKNFIGGTVALLGAALVSWQSVAIYFQLTGRIQAGEEHPPSGFAAALIIIGILFVAMGHRLSSDRDSQ